MLTDFLLRNIFKKDDEIVITLSKKVQKGSLFAPVKTKSVWKKESLSTKIKSILSLKWEPSQNLLQEAGKKIFIQDVFGPPADYGDKLFALIAWHQSREWDLGHLTLLDTVKADAIEAMTILTRLRYNQTSQHLHLDLQQRAPFISVLTHAMVIKIPIISLQYFLTVHSHFAFNAIRKASHPQSDGLIDYLYELLYLQQKTAISLHELLLRIDYAEKHKNDALFINAEINAIITTDGLFAYLKATVEKTIALVGLTFGITNLDSKKEHKKRMTALKQGLPQKVLDLYYFQFMFDLFSSGRLDELNNYRSGILHKKGIADLQPHNYVNKNVESLPLLKIFSVLKEQHAKNTAALIGALALLTDQLAELDFPDITLDDFEELSRAATADFPFNKNWIDEQDDLIEKVHI